VEPYTSIEKIDSISYQDFLERYAKPKIPVVLKNASAAWESNQIFTPEFFEKNFGQYETSAGEKRYTLSQILDLTAKSTPENPAPYPLQYEIPEQMPELMKLLQPIDMGFSHPNWFRSKMLPYGKLGNSIHLFVGGKGNQYGLHKDFHHTNAWITQLYGEKKFIVFPGNQDEYLYAGKSGYSKFLSPVNFVTPDYDKYPKFKQAKSVEVILQPGETIFIPNDLWHTTVAYGQNISLIYDQLNSRNYRAWTRDVYELKKDESKLKAAIQYSFAVATGAVCTLAEWGGKKF
jgi:histone arginine demethylase JMJD6